MADKNHGVLRHRLRGNAHERKQIRRSENSTFRRGIGTMLNQGVDGNREESGEEAENAEQNGDRVVGKAVAEEQRGINRHANHSERN